MKFKLFCWANPVEQTTIRLIKNIVIVPNKDFRKQSEVLKNIASQISNGEKNILGVMLESHLKDGNQKLLKKEDLQFGRSITDACIGIETTKELLAILYNSLS